MSDNSTMSDLKSPKKIGIRCFDKSLAGFKLYFKMIVLLIVIVCVLSAIIFILPLGTNEYDKRIRWVIGMPFYICAIIAWVSGIRTIAGKNPSNCTKFTKTSQVLWPFVTS